MEVVSGDEYSLGHSDFGLDQVEVVSYWYWYLVGNKQKNLFVDIYLEWAQMPD